MPDRAARVRVPRTALLILGCLAACAARAVDVTTWRYDISRSGQNTSELTLQPANVNSSTFGKLYSYAVDGYVYAQPLYLGRLNFGGIIHNTLFVATEHDSVFAFDADANRKLWSVSLIDTAHGAASGATTVPSSDVATGDLVPEIGITGTPVIDGAAGTLYVVAKSKENGTYVQRKGRQPRRHTGFSRRQRRRQLRRLDRVSAAVAAEPPRAAAAQRHSLRRVRVAWRQRAVPRLGIRL
jgi:hypothetical protein